MLNSIKLIPFQFHKKTILFLTYNKLQVALTIYKFVHHPITPKPGSLTVPMIE